MSDSYPEYLNPFAEDLKPKPKLTIRNSFKELKRNIRQSFRIKKKDHEVFIRPKNDTFQHLPTSRHTIQTEALPRSRHTIQTEALPRSRNTIQTEALPRSRFRERLARSEHMNGDKSTINPFDEEETEIKTTLVRRKGKKRAPLPPKSVSSQHINDESLEIPNGGSNWSLTSVETDYSENTTREENPEETRRGSLIENFVDFNKEMDALKDDTNNNVITETENSTIPDLVVSCPSEVEEPKEEELVVKDITDNMVEPQECLTHNEEKSIPKEELVVKDVTDNMVEPQESLTYNEEKSIPKEELVVKDITDNMRESQESLTHNEEKSISNEDLVVKDITANMIEPEKSITYHHKKSIYIAGSQDELNESTTYTGRVSLYITGSCDDLDASNNNEVLDENSNDSAVPTPKQRKNKLTKNMLLGM